MSHTDKQDCNSEKEKKKKENGNSENYYCIIRSGFAYLLFFFLITHKLPL